MHLFLSCIGAHYDGDDRHAQEIMKDLGIKYDIRVKHMKVNMMLT